MTTATLTKPKLLIGIFIILGVFVFLGLKDSHDAGDQTAASGFSGTPFVIMLIAAFGFLAVTGYFFKKTLDKKKELEKKLEYTQRRADESIQVKDQFMANMSHEIRTPLNAILGFGNRLGKTELNAEQKEYVNAIRSSGETLLNIINDILDFAKIETGQSKLEELRFSIKDLLQSAHVTFKEKAREKNNILEFHLADELPDQVLGDSARLTQILVNIIGNALKFTENGRIDIYTEVLKQTSDKVTVQFKIKDSGIGIPPEKLNEIFERFAQEKHDNSRLYGGTGLGLSIAKKLVELQNGFITASSVQGKGATFTFFIPFKKAPANETILSVSKEMPVEKRNDINILVVEDNLLNQKLAAYMLKDWGFKCDISANGSKALERLKKNDYDLILMDIQMPELNGYQTTQVIRKELGLHVPILAMTAHALPGEKEKCINYGMNDYISKPIKEHDLFNLINRYLDTDQDNLKTKGLLA